MILSAQTIRRLQPLHPFVERGVIRGRSFGLSHAGYDIRIDGSYTIEARSFILAASLEEFNMPVDIMAVVHDKSSWAREGLSVFNTVIEPGWKGHLTLELNNLAAYSQNLQHGDPIAQIIFHRVDEPVETPYTGKYQNQERGPQKTRYEE